MSGIETWSTNPALNNQATPYGWPAGMAPNAVEPTARQTMASVRSWYETAEWLNFGDTPTYISASQFSVPGNLTARYHVGRRVQATNGTSTVYGSITATSYSSLTTVTVSVDASGSLPTGMTIVWVGATSAINTSFIPPLASSSSSCSGNAATATVASSCSGNSATATTASSCSGNSATATTAAACSGNAATASTAAACS